MCHSALRCAAVAAVAFIFLALSGPQAGRGAGLKRGVPLNLASNCIEIALLTPCAEQRAAELQNCLYQIGSTIDGCENNLFNEGVLQKTQKADRGGERCRRQHQQRQQAVDNNNNRLQQQQQQQQTSNNNDIWRK